MNPKIYHSFFNQLFFFILNMVPLISKIAFQFPRRFRPPLSVGNKFTDHFPSVVDRVQSPIKTGTTCLPWLASRMLGEGNLMIEESQGISNFSTHHFGPYFR